MKNRIIKNIEYWIDGMTSSYQVTKAEFYNIYNDCYSGFRKIDFEDGSTIYCNKKIVKI